VTRARVALAWLAFTYAVAVAVSHVTSFFLSLLKAGPA